MGGERISYTRTKSGIFYMNMCIRVKICPVCRKEIAIENYKWLSLEKKDSGNSIELSYISIELCDNCEKSLLKITEEEIEKNNALGISSGENNSTN